MIQKYERRAKLLGIIVWIFLFLGELVIAIILRVLLDSNILSISDALFVGKATYYIILYALFSWACTTLAQAKGYSPLYGLFALFPPALLAIVFLPDKKKKRQT
ncbi:MAG: hypothetical protein NZ772_00205 [Cyanobacteria bacterium]|nr:hypothetical protein [Cyanobacteriota bacterium]MDW8199599.1 hypothetical protein [Cyanobacteriota bacterium SKYGB_h_bin112]